ncbi:hypothetical protein HYT02_03075 [Candidatus Gottesmanbacteria bacterium]|nr:hypothetical protein [Candidatus Gottesmanbacteria bacterium]
MLEITLSVKNKYIDKSKEFLDKYILLILIGALTAISIVYFVTYLNNGLGLAYNDARSHLDIGRRVVEGLKPGLAQLGSVWLPLPHLLMVPTIWNDYFWHSGLSGALQSMISFVATAIIIHFFLKEMGVSIFGRLVGVMVFVANLNILYLQSIAMTELLLIATMTAGVYELYLWHKNGQILNIIKSSFWIMMASLIRYEGWFLMLYAGVLIIIEVFKRKGFKSAEGTAVFYATLAAFGVFLWFLWNLLIFKDPLYFILGPFSAKAQQDQLEAAGVLITKSNLLLSIKIYLYALFYNSYTIPAILALFGAILYWTDKKIKPGLKIAITALFAPLMFNILALYLGHSVLFIQGISGTSWFNVRYGIMMMPSISIFIGYLVSRIKDFRWVIVGILLFITYFAFSNYDAVTIDDARVGSSQKNVSEVSGYLAQNSANEKGFILVSAASHDAIIFSSGLPMKRFIHEGTGAYWESATTSPDSWARWIIMRTNDDNDLVWRSVSRVPAFDNYILVASYPFADIYEIKQELIGQLHTEPVLGKQK